MENVETIAEGTTGRTLADTPKGIRRKSLKGVLRIIFEGISGENLKVIFGGSVVTISGRTPEGFPAGTSK